MPSQFKLLESNAQLKLDGNYYRDTTILERESALSSYLQTKVPDFLDEVADKSLFSLDIEAAADTNELRAAFSLSQFRFLQAFDYSQVSNALDLSEDLGGVAHYLSTQVDSVESIKIDSGAAYLSAHRCAREKNICFVSEDLNKISFPKKRYDLIVLGQLEALKLSIKGLNALLKKLKAALSENGVLVVNAINQQRISKWFDADSITPDSADFTDLYQYESNSDKVVEQNRKQLRDTLLDCQFSTVEFHSNFSKGVNCHNLFSEDYLVGHRNVLNHFYRLGSISNPQINEYLLYRKFIKENKNLVDMANRYLVIAGNGYQHTRQLYNNDFSHFPGGGRQAQWRTITSRSRAAHEVIKKPVYPGVDPATRLLTQNLEAHPFHTGRILVGDWLQAILENDHTQFTQLVEEYYDWLTELESTKDFDKIAYDLLPFNIVVDDTNDQRNFKTIDTEWQLNAPFSADFVLFRALFWFAFQNKPLLKAYRTPNDVYSIGMFVVNHMPNANQVNDLHEFVKLEERIQADIDHSFRANAVNHALFQSFDDEVKASETPLRLQVFWGNDGGVMDMQNSVVTDWQKSTALQTVEVELPPYSASRPVLRIDPMMTSGAFRFTRLALRNKAGEIIWELNSAAEINRMAELFGTSVSGDEHDIFIALNDDPNLRFDLKDVKMISNASHLCAELAWVWGDNYSAAIATLSQAVSAQSSALISQTFRMNEYLADIKFQQARINDLLSHKETMVGLLNHTRQLELSLDQLQGFINMRASTRIKNSVTRLVDVAKGRQVIEAEPEPEDIEEEVTEIPLPTKELLGQNLEDYDLWVSQNTLTDKEIETAKAEIDAMAIKPLFSILVPIYNTDPNYLLPMIRSVQEQIYPHWELCLVDDCSPNTYLRTLLEYEALKDQRIKIQLNEVNQGIAITTNDALAMATGDYIALLDHDDEITVDALYYSARAINQTPDAGLLYSDEDKMDMEGGRLEPFFKPDYSPDLLHTNNYICHFTVIKKSIADQIGGFRAGLDGSQDHDIILRAADVAERVVHIPKILYHWRKIPGSTAVEYDSKSYAWEAGRKAVEDSLQKHEDGVRVEFGALKGTYRVFRDIKGEPLVSIIIPFKDKPALLDSCLSSILNRSSYQNFEIIGVSNNSEESLTFARMEHFKQADERVRFVEKNVPFNFSEVCNYGVEHANGEYIILLNNDIEIITTDWIERLLEHAQRKEVGAVGGKLLYPDGRIQHAGIVAGMVGAAGHPHKFFPDNHIGYHGRLHMVYNVSAVTGAMLMISKAKYQEVNGLDQDNLAVAYNDVDFCLKLGQQGYYNLFTPHAVATHHESISRGYEDTEEKLQRLLKEQNFFLEKWDHFLQQGDPYYNPNLSLENERFSLKFKD